MRGRLARVLDNVAAAMRSPHPGEPGYPDDDGDDDDPGDDPDDGERRAA
jgi:hypothetical protein